MNILHLRYAVEVEKTGSITQAADNLYMGQPNLSKAIKELEANIGISIFKRTSKGVVPTKKGEEFLNYARNILSEIDEMESLYRPEDSNKQSFSISIPRASYVTHTFTKFVNTLDNTKEIEINFKETNSMNVINNIIENEYNLGIIRYQTIYEKYFLNLLRDKDITFDEIWEFEYLVLMSKDHPLAYCNEVSYHELSRYIEITHGDLSVPYLSLSEVKKSEETVHTKKRIYVYERGSQFDLLRQVPATYIWVSPIPKELLDLYGLVQRKCNAANHKYKDLLIHLKSYKLSELDKRFISELHRVRDELSSRRYT